MRSNKRLAISILAVAAVIVVAAVALISLAGGSKEPGTVPGAVTGLQVERIDAGSVQLSWKQVKDAKTYEVYRSQDNTDQYELTDVVKAPEGTSWTDANCDEKTIFFYKVRAISDQEGPFSEDVASGEIAYQIPVFAYHRFCAKVHWEEKGTGNYLFCDQSEFERQMKYLADNHYRTITSDEIYRWHEGQMELPKKTVMLTMDDGNRSVLMYALPVLEKYDLNATVFIIGSSMPKVTDYEEYAVDSYHHMGEDLMNQTMEESDNLDFQSHTYDLHHSVNGERAMKVATKEELETDTAYMNETYGFTSLAYPFGTYTDEMIDVLNENGNYTVAFTYGDDAYTTRFDDRFKMNRIKVYGSTTYEEFLNWLDY